MLFRSSSVCDTALLYGYTDDAKIIDLGIVERVIKNRGIQAGICDDDPTEEIAGQPATSSQKATGRSRDAGQLKNRLVSIEQRLEKLESKDNHDVVMQLMKSLNNLHRENAILRKKYYSLLNKDKETQSNGKAKPDKRTAKFSPISLEKKS